MHVSNPLFDASDLPYGLPPFAEIRDEHYRPAFGRGFEEQRAEVAAIVANPDPPTFANTIEALERSGRTLARTLRVFSNKSSADANETTIALEEELAPLLAAHEDSILLDAALYARVDALHRDADRLDLTAEQRYLLERRHREMTLAGAALGEEQKALLTDCNQRISTLTARFERNLLADTNDLAVVFDSPDELDGLSEAELSATAEAARERGLDGRHLVTLVLPTGHPYLASLTNRESRRRIMAASRSRGARGNEWDTRAIVLELTRLRAERARLLGFPSHAAAVTAGQTAGTPAAVDSLLRRLAAPAARNARAEQADLQAAVGDAFALEAHDWAFYAEKVRVAKHDVDTSLMRPYLEAERVLQHGVFYAATRLYGVTFEERTDLAAYHPDVRVFEVRDEDGSGVGLYLLDLYTRDSKRGGAWMNDLVGQNALLGDPVVVVNNLNVPKPAPGQPTLLTIDQVSTLFHEFGHALHGLFARVTYPSLSGTSVYRDFVEFPSQVNEMWMLWPEVLENYAVHHETGERMPAELAERLRASEQFNEGFATSEYLAAAMLDQSWHSLGPEDSVEDVAAFEAAALADAGLDNPVVPSRYQSTYFAHVFSGGYDAGYYGYVWSEVLDADTVEWFRENGGLSRENGERFRRRLLGVGGSKDPLEAYRDFRGRDADIQPLLDRRGLR